MEPIYLKHDGAPTVMVTSLSQARLLEANGFVRCEPDPDAIPAGAAVFLPEPVDVTANIRSEDEPEPQPPGGEAQPPMATGDETPQPPAPTFPGELAPGEYTNPPSKPKAKGPAKK